MSLLADHQILKLCQDHEMIVPFFKESIKTMETRNGIQKILSKGVSSYGYDITLSPEDLKIFVNTNAVLIDPRKVDKEAYVQPLLKIDNDGLMYVVQPPNSVMLGHTREYFKMPRDVLATCLGKSTYARVGVSLLVTPLEPAWEGVLVVEIVNSTSSAVKIYVDQGIGQLLFFRAEEECTTSYADRGGKYQGQKSTVDALV